MSSEESGAEVSRSATDESHVMTRVSATRNLRSASSPDRTEQAFKSDRHTDEWTTFTDSRTFGWGYDSQSKTKREDTERVGASAQPSTATMPAIRSETA